MLQQRTLDLIESKVRDQDVMYFLRGLAANFSAHCTVVKYYENNYDRVSVLWLCLVLLTELTGPRQLTQRFKNNFTMKYLVTVSHCPSYFGRQWS